VPAHCTPPTYLHGERPTSSAAVFLLQSRPTVGRVFLRGLCRAESPPAVSACSACSAGFLCACCHFLPAMPTALLIICPRSLASSLLCPHSCAFACHLFIPCAPGSPLSRAGDLFQIGPAVCKLRTVPLAAATRACSGGPCTGPFDSRFLFLAESMILGHGGSVNL